MRFALIAIIVIACATEAQARDPHCRSVRVVKDSYWAGVAGPIYGYLCDGKQSRVRKSDVRTK